MLQNDGSFTGLVCGCAGGGTEETLVNPGGGFPTDEDNPGGGGKGAEVTTGENPGGGNLSGLLFTNAGKSSSGPGYDGPGLANVFNPGGSL